MIEYLLSRQSFQANQLHRIIFRIEMTSGFKDLFAKQAATYLSHRPSYPDSLFTFLVSQCAHKNLAVDIATGSGQAAISLSKHFNRYIRLLIYQRYCNRAIGWPTSTSKICHEVFQQHRPCPRKCRTRLAERVSWS